MPESKPSAMQQIIEALSIAVRQNGHDLVREVMRAAAGGNQQPEGEKR